MRLKDLNYILCYLHIILDKRDNTGPSWFLQILNNGDSSPLII
jgi:hypothetical protein